MWPWNDLAATSETTPESATAAAIVQRLIREASLRPASRALTAGAEALARAAAVLLPFGGALPRAAPALPRAPVLPRAAPALPRVPDAECSDFTATMIGGARKKTLNGR